MAVVIRLSRTGKKSHATYRIAASEKRSKRDGRVIEYLGFYNPGVRPKVLSINKLRVTHWLNHGAKLSTTVAHLVKKMP